MKSVKLYLLAAAVALLAGCASGPTNEMVEEEVVNGSVTNVVFTKQLWLNPHAGYYTKFYAENRTSHKVCVHIFEEGGSGSDFHPNHSRGYPLDPGQKEKMATWDQERDGIDVEYWAWEPRNGVCEPSDFNASR